MNLGHKNSSHRSFMGDDMMAMKRCRYISSTEKEFFVGTGTTCLVLYSSETHRIQVLHDIEAVYPRAHTMDINPGNWNCDSFLNELSLRRINNRSVEIFVLLQEKSLTNTLFLRQWREWGLPAYFTEYVRVAPEKEYYKHLICRCGEGKIPHISKRFVIYHSVWQKQKSFWRLGKKSKNFTQIDFSFPVLEERQAQALIHAFANMNEDGVLISIKETQGVWDYFPLFALFFDESISM